MLHVIILCISRGHWRSSTVILRWFIWNYWESVNGTQLSRGGTCMYIVQNSTRLRVVVLLNMIAIHSQNFIKLLTVQFCLYYICDLSHIIKGWTSMNGENNWGQEFVVEIERIHSLTQSKFIICVPIVLLFVLCCCFFDYRLSSHYSILWSLVSLIVIQSLLTLLISWLILGNCIF